MSRLESNPNPIFKIAKDEEIKHPGLLAVPLSLRKQAVEQFDREFRLSDARNAEALQNNSEPKATSSLDLAPYLSNARLLFAEGEFEVAQEMYSAVLKLDPQNDLAIRGLSECAQQLRQHEDAILVLRKLVANKASAENYKRLGDQLYLMEYNEDAIEAYLRALGFEDIEAEAQFQILKNCGNILLRLGDADGAEEYYNKAYTLGPDSDALLVNYGSLALYRGELDKSLNRFREAVGLNCANDKAWVGLAMIHREYGDLELAWANVEKALDINSRNESAIKLVADWAMKDNEIEKAIRRLEIYLGQNAQDAEMSMWLSKFYYFSGFFEPALRTIETALRLRPDIEGGLEVLKVIRAEMHERGIFSK